MKAAGALRDAVPYLSQENDVPDHNRPFVGSDHKLAVVAHSVRHQFLGFRRSLGISQTTSPPEEAIKSRA
jgi:hypothetical protein